MSHLLFSFSLSPNHLLIPGGGGGKKMGEAPQVFRTYTAQPA